MGTKRASAVVRIPLSTPEGRIAVPNSRYIAIGDIHGCPDQLEELEVID